MYGIGNKLLKINLNRKKFNNHIIILIKKKL